MMVSSVITRPVRVLIVDDSAMMRKVLSMGLSADPGIEVVGMASDGEKALDMVESLDPDVITLDIEMPRIDGVTFLQGLMPKRPVPTVVISSVTSAGADITLRALEAGAVDVIAKPSLGAMSGASGVMADICQRVRAAALAKPIMGGQRVSQITLRARPRPSNHIIVIGASTGGVQALATLLPMMPPDAPPIAIVQHMPEGFTNSFARRLDMACRIKVREAQDGDELAPGLALIAPGGNRHMLLAGQMPSLRVVLQEGPPVCFSTPSVDVLFDCAARRIGMNCAAALLTGMGKDGAEGMLAIRRAGGRTIAQDEASSVVWGMPGQAVAIGAAEQILPLSYIAAGLLDTPATRLPQYRKIEGYGQ
jgi:two-component system chemotaxis response regulator CheB